MWVLITHHWGYGIEYCVLVADLFILTGAVALGVHLNLESPEPNGTYWYPVTATDNITVEPLSKDTSLHFW